jgi:hypothetical protein
MRTCPFKNCCESIPDHLFACRGHWRSMSPDEQRQIHVLYGRYLDGRIGIEELRNEQQEVLGARGTA